MGGGRVAVSLVGEQRVFRCPTSVELGGKDEKTVLKPTDVTSAHGQPTRDKNILIAKKNCRK